ncbi:hypothetical protein PU630_15535 [Microbacterium horticulturae]|uniref:Sigma-70, region 4 n=1 Tax=Microbacterium horticulturae TaxID=3028316 RepID=A0ABY8BXM7_9MICO|nr:hypothetical protein [Microbacterium sp. KACC 23027]WEG08637.1 hypothetical protein PU630_15535 [Microbacterium sp. KACC 23027]
MTAVERAETRVTLLKEAVDIVARLEANEAEHSELLAKRAEACKALRAAGTPIKELQETLGVSRSRVNQLLSEAA